MSVEERRRYMKMIWSDDPEVRRRHLARKKVQYAVKTGKLTRPDTCSRCRRAEIVESHHEDYDKPLDVIWVCKRCHAELEMENSR